MADFDQDDFNREVGLLLQVARKRAGLTQVAIAKQIGIPRASYANLELGRQRIPVDVLWRVAIVVKSNLTLLTPRRGNYHRSPILTNTCGYVTNIEFLTPSRDEKHG